MTYEKLIELVLAGKSVNARSKEIGMPQRTLAQYAAAESFPDCNVAIMFANLAGVSVEEAVTAIALKSLEKKPKQAYSFLRPAMATVLMSVFSVSLFLTPTPSQAAPAKALSDLSNLHYVK